MSRDEDWRPPRIPIGARVIVLREVKLGKAYSFGYGIYEGRFPVGDEAEKTPALEGKVSLGEIMAERSGGTLLNPRVRLDSGKCVWGYQCWWMEIDVFRKKYGGIEVVEVDLKEYQDKFSERNKGMN